MDIGPKPLEQRHQFSDQYLFLIIQLLGKKSFSTGQLGKSHGGAQGKSLRQMLLHQPLLFGGIAIIQLFL